MKQTDGIGCGFMITTSSKVLLYATFQMFPMVLLTSSLKDCIVSQRPVATKISRPMVFCFLNLMFPKDRVYRNGPIKRVHHWENKTCTSLGKTTRQINSIQPNTLLRTLQSRPTGAVMFRHTQDKDTYNDNFFSNSYVDSSIVCQYFQCDST